MAARGHILDLHLSVANHPGSICQRPWFSPYCHNLRPDSFCLESHLKESKAQKNKGVKTVTTQMRAGATRHAVHL